MKRLEMRKNHTMLTEKLQNQYQYYHLEKMVNKNML